LWPGEQAPPAITICKDSRAELVMAEVVLNNVRKNYDPAIHKDTLRNINLSIKEVSKPYL
jgi:hypothetical protein